MSVIVLCHFCGRGYEEPAGEKCVKPWQAQQRATCS